MKISEVAKQTGITVRTLHYYDKIGLLSPSQISPAGYRIYNKEALETLQQILFFKELDFPLEQIKEIMLNPNYNKTEVLVKHKELLLQKRNRLDGLIDLVEDILKGGNQMSFKEFDITEIEANRNKYAAEVKERWGETPAFKESQAKTACYAKPQWEILNKEGLKILKAFGENRHMPPNSQQAQKLVADWQEYITANFYKCTKEILSCLGEMYLNDLRFAENIDKQGKGTAEFIAAAIEVYCTNEPNK